MFFFRSTIATNHSYIEILIRVYHAFFFLEKKLGSTLDNRRKQPRGICPFWLRLHFKNDQLPMWSISQMECKEKQQHSAVDIVRKLHFQI